MARIPESEIERIKGEVSLERLVEASGVELKKSGKDLVGLCPFHDDHEPSLRVTPATNLWSCPSCGATGNVIQWVMKRNGVSFRHAMELLREGLGAVGASPVKKTTVRALPPPVSFDADDQALRNQVALVYYAGELKRSPEALAYLKARGIDSAEAIERFKLGYANRTLGLRLPNSQRVTGSRIRERLQRVGILRESGHEHFNGSLVIPILDEAGNVVEMYGRKIVRALRSGTAKHLYLPEECRGASRGVWNWEALAASKEIILCEALIDALTFWCAGFRNVTSAYGTGGFSDEHVAAFKRHGVERVLIAYDHDEPGERGAESVTERLTAEGIECWRVQFPKGMDANEYALKVQPAVKSLGVAVRKALWLGKGKAPESSPTSAPIAADVEDLAPIAAVAPIVDEPRAIERADAASSLAADLAAKEKTEAEPIAASPIPLAPSAPNDEPAVTEAEIALSYGERSYRVRGLAKNTSYEVLKVNVLAARGERFHVDTVDLRNSKQKHSYISQTALELEVREDIVKDDLGKLFFKLEAMRDEAIERALAPKASPAVAMAEPEREAALALLRSPQLIERILADLEACGLVGERTNKLVGYLAATSRKLDQPLAVLVQSSSAAG
jgi:DNA primase catalytic core